MTCLIQQGLDETDMTQIFFLPQQNRLLFLQLLNRWKLLKEVVLGPASIPWIFRDWTWKWIHNGFFKLIVFSGRQELSNVTDLNLQKCLEFSSITDQHKDNVQSLSWKIYHYFYFMHGPRVQFSIILSGRVVYLTTCRLSCSDTVTHFIHPSTQF